MKQPKSNKKFNDDYWYVVYDGSSAFALLGMNCQEFLDEDSEVNEILSGPVGEKQVDDLVDYWNARICD